MRDLGDDSVRDVRLNAIAWFDGIGDGGWQIQLRRRRRSWALHHHLQHQTTTNPRDRINPVYSKLSRSGWFRFSKFLSKTKLFTCLLCVRCTKQESFQAIEVCHHTLSFKPKLTPQQKIKNDKILLKLKIMWWYFS